MVHVPAAPSSTGSNAPGASPCGAVNQNVTPETDTQIARTFGPAGSSCSMRPNRQLAASKEWSAGTSAKRCRRVAASTASSETGSARDRR